MINGMKVALQLYSVRDVMEKDFEGALRKVSEMGYEGVEFAGLYGYDPLKIKALLNKYHLIPISAHVPVGELAADPLRYIAIYKKIGCSYLAIPWLGENDRPGRAGYNKVKAVIIRAAAECAKQDVILLYHNHDFEYGDI